MAPQVALTVAFTLAALILWRVTRNKRSLPFPPGPKGIPILGNALQMPTQYEHETYREWAQKYNSPVLYINALGVSIVILDDYETAMDILDKRSGIYSDRPDIPMVRLMGWDKQLSMLPYGDQWRHSRRIFSDVISQRTNVRFWPLLERARNRLLNDFLVNPDDFEKHLKLAAGSTMFDLAYGFKVDSNDDPMMDRFSRATTAITQSASPATFLINMFPIIEHFPSWAPGTSFRPWADKWKKETEDSVEGCYKLAKDKIVNDTATTSFISDALHELGEKITDQDEESIKYVAMTMYSAGSDTSKAVVQAFILAMVLFPEVQVKAQAEIRQVCAEDHLPNYREVERYPYLTALIMELLRWSIPSPLGVPHLVQSEDIYNGYYIPAGTYVMPNQWSMLRNEKHYPEPFAFKPERFLTKEGKINPNVRDPRDIAFGFGRRICPGRFFAETSIWISISAILTVFDIQRSEETKLPDDEKRCFAHAIVVHPISFKCSIKPRSEEAVQLIKHLEW